MARSGEYSGTCLTPVFESPITAYCEFSEPVPAVVEMQMSLSFRSLQCRADLAGPIRVWPFLPRKRLDRLRCLSFFPLTARPPVVCICGAKKSGKTLLMARLVRHLSELGLAVGTLKHDGHDFDLGGSPDREGTDSWRHRAAGARASAVFSARRWALFRDGEPELETLLDLMSDMDLILAEGLRGSEWPK